MNIPGWSEDMMKSWTDAQQKYWANLMSASRNAAGGSAGMPDWAEGMEKWWSMVTPQMPAQANELMSRVFEMGKVYTRLAEDAVAATSGSENKNVLEGWMASMEKGFKDWPVQSGTDFSNLGAGWQQMMDSMGMGAFKTMPAMTNMLPGSAMWQEQMKKMLDASGLAGSIPQESQKKLAELTTNYQKAMQDYMGAFSGQGVDSVQALRERMLQMGSEGVSITSLRELYDLWVDVSEEVYQKFAMSDHYQEVYGQMVNSFVALKGGIDTVREAQLQALRILTADNPGELVKNEADNKTEDKTAAKKPVAKQAAAKKPAAKKAAETSDSTSKPAPAKPAKSPAKQASDAKPKPAATEVKAAAKAKAKVAAPKATAPKSEPAEVKVADKTVKAAAPEAKAENAEIKAGDEPKPDDLTRIKGLGPKMQEKLIDAGIQTFDQLAALSDDQAQVLDKQLDARGRLVRENWVTQASEMSGSKLA